MKRSCQLNEDFVCAESCFEEKLVCAGLWRQRDSVVSVVSLSKTRATSVSVRQEVRRGRPGKQMQSLPDRSFGKKCRSTSSQKGSGTNRQLARSVLRTIDS
ncbi:MAG: hypothetical protein DWI00_15505 [Planctomycetota bacterium]|nr:MAG: hypothetical protein DWI00_15505 [Planctomycetota bacterium]